MRRQILIGFLLSWTLLLADNHAQTIEPKPAEPKLAEPKLVEPKSLQSIRALKSTIDSIKVERAAKQEEQKNATSLAEKEALAAEIKVLKVRISELTSELESVATGVDVRQLDGKYDDAIAFDEELREFFRPIVQEAKRATAKPRELEQLRSAVSFHSKRVGMADRALLQLGELITKTQNEETKALLITMQESWIAKKQEFQNELIAANYQLDQRVSNEDSLWDTLSDGVATFFRTRGKNIFIALAAMALTYCLLRFLHRSVERYSPFRKKGNTFSARLFDVIYFAATGLLTVCAGLAALYALGDWMLLGFALILIAGFVWASKTAIPSVGEQVKLMLNLGPVREGERVVFNGIPWLVQKISIYTRLVNPSLEGGELRLPLRDLIPISSRPVADKEPFFPTEKGSWVLLADATYGKVVRQTPEWVQLVKLGSSQKTYATTDFIAQTPENISLGFRISQVFGIDYAHQSIATTSVPKILTERVTAGLAEVIGSEHITNIRVEFASAGASSLDMAVLADLKGDAASKYNQAGRAIQRICVEVCNEQGWVIPFTQITVHQAS